MALPLDIIVGQPTTQSMNLMTDQLAKMCAAVRTTAFGGKHGSLAAVLDDPEYQTVTTNTSSSTTPLTEPALVSTSLAKEATPYEILQAQETAHKAKKAFAIQEAVREIGVERIVASVEEQYIEEQSVEYFGYANETIKSLLKHLRDTWCKVLTKEKSNARTAFYQPWPESHHIITFGRYLDKQQKLCKNIGIPISDTDKVLYFVEQMYARGEFKEEEMTIYERKTDPDKDWHSTLTYFTELFERKKAYREDRASHTGFESAAHISDTKSVASGALPPHRASSMRSTGSVAQPSTALPATDDDWIQYNNYVEELEDTVADAKEYAASISTTQNDKLLDEVKAQRDQTTAALAQMTQMFALLQQNAAGVVAIPAAPNPPNPARAKHKCKNCGKMVFHQDAKCFKLESNKANRPVWYKDE